MNKRIEIKISVVGEENAGKETFAKMLFLDNVSKIRVDPLSLLAEMYLETDMVNFQNTTKKIIEECKQHNDLIMKQKEIKNIQSLRDFGLFPYFYKHTNRIRDLVDFEPSNSDKNGRLNENILLTFYFIGNNYKEFKEEISNSNIIIYITDINRSCEIDSPLFKFINLLVQESENKKYLLTLINKCDNLNINGEYDTDSEGPRPEAPCLSSGQQVDRELRGSREACRPAPKGDRGSTILPSLASASQGHKIIKELMNSQNMPQNIFPPILISSKYAYIYRQIQYNDNFDIGPEDKIIIATTFNNKIDKIIKDIGRNGTKYLKQSGFVSFRDILVGILNCNYKSMIDDNISTDIKNTEKILNNRPDDVPLELSNLKNKAARIEKIFKKKYDSNINDLTKKFLKQTIDLSVPSLTNVRKIIRIYGEDKEMSKLINATYKQIKNKIILSMTNKLYNNEIDANIFMPSKVHITFDELCDLCLSKEDMNKLSFHICELYSNRARQLLQSEKNINLLFVSYFDKNECTNMVYILNFISSKIECEIYKIYLIQILLTKLMIAEKCINIKDTMGKENIHYIIAFCKFIKCYLLNNTTKKYDYLFLSINDICTSIILKFDGLTQLQYLSENIVTVLNFKPGQIITLEKFIVKMIKKNSYKYLIETSQNDAASDSENNVNSDEQIKIDFSKDDLQSQDCDNEIITEKIVTERADPKSGLVTGKLVSDVTKSVTGKLVSDVTKSKKKSKRKKKSNTVDI